MADIGVKRHIIKLGQGLIRERSCKAVGLWLLQEVENVTIKEMAVSK